MICMYTYEPGWKKGVSLPCLLVSLYIMTIPLKCNFSATVQPIGFPWSILSPAPLEDQFVHCLSSLLRSVYPADNFACCFTENRSKQKKTKNAVTTLSSNGVSQVSLQIVVSVQCFSSCEGKKKKRGKALDSISFSVTV